VAPDLPVKRDDDTLIFSERAIMGQALAGSGGRLSAAEQSGVFEGYASLFNVPDSAGDVVMPGAFAASLARRGRQGIRMLFQHDANQPVGTWLELREDARGLFVRGRLAAGVQHAEELGTLLRQGAIDGLSIGFRAVLATRDRLTRQRRLMKIDLWEISLVTFPMLEGARVTALAGAPTAPLRKVRSRDGPQGSGSLAPDRASATAAAIQAGGRQLLPPSFSGAKR
jgi:HK97 family phage prohead protease